MKYSYTILISTTLRKIFFIVFFVALNSLLFGQQLTPISILKQNNLSSTSNFYQIQKAMEDYWDSKSLFKIGIADEDGEDGGAPGWSLYKRWEYYWEQRINTQTGEFPKTNSVIEYEKYKQSKNSLNKLSTYNESWSNLGTNSSDGGYAGIGRINCIAFHPTDNNTFWVGSPSGGIWKTTDGGADWIILNNDQLVLGVSAIAIPSDYASTNTIYIATGDRDGGSLWSLGGGNAADNVSIGVLKSTDGGATWNTTGLSYSEDLGKSIYSLRIDPTDNSILFAATSDGIYKSTNSGASWNIKTANVWGDIEFKPGDHNIMYASSIPYGGTYINRSTNNGESWSFGSAIATNGRRGEIAVSPNDPTVVYLLAANSAGGVNGVYKSMDSGVSFTKVNNNSGTQPGMLGYYTDGSGDSSGQGSYDLCIAVDPSDVNTVFIGGITTWKSTDGGVNWSAINNWVSSATYNKSGVAVVHADKHSLIYQNSSTLFEGCDGGIYKTTNGGTSYTDLTNGMIISQIYRIGVSQTNTTTILTGLQDNGSKLYNAGFWSDVTGGDGMECIVDYSNTNYMYATYVKGEIYRSTNGGASFPTTISANIPGGQPTGAWVTPYVIDQNNSSTLFAGYNKVWKTTDRGNSWTSASQQLSAAAKIRSLAIAPSNSNVLYAADQTHMWKTTDGGATNWSTLTLPSTSTSVTYIAVKNDDPNTLWITYGGYIDSSKVYQSTDGGGSWTNISTGLPNLPVLCIVHYKVSSNRIVLFVGTDIGVLVKDGLNDWVPFSNGLPNVVVSELEILYSGGGNDKLRAGTFGRGLWETNIDAGLPVELSSFEIDFDKYQNIKLNWITSSEINNKGFEIQRKYSNSNTWEDLDFIEGNGTTTQKNSYTYIDAILPAGKYLYRLKQIDFNGSFEYSNIVEIEVIAPDNFELNQNFPNPFNPVTKISFQIPGQYFVSLKVYDILGNEVATLVNEKKSAGKYNVDFNASALPSGVYFYKLQAGSFVQTKKMILLK